MVGGAVAETLSLLATILLFTAAAHSAVTEKPPVLVELFTSQSCSSCPPAEANFRTLAQRKDVVALEWHVDYWNRISVGADGKWRDPFSTPESTARQRAYNIALRGTGAVYTPQAIINGATETVGSRGREIDRLISAATALGAASISIKPAGERQSARIQGHEGAFVRLVTFRRSATTRVGGGENARAELAEANVVTGVATLGRLGAEDTAFSFASPNALEGCAILVESEDGAPLAARYCLRTSGD